MSEDADTYGKGNILGCCARCSLEFDLTRGLECPRCSSTKLKWARKPEVPSWGFWRPERWTPSTRVTAWETLLTDDDRALLKGMRITLSKKETQ